LAVSVDDIGRPDHDSVIHGYSTESTRRREAEMSNLLERLLTWIADAVDRSLLPVPEVDDEWPTPVGRPRQGQWQWQWQEGDPTPDRHERQYWRDAATPIER
jgi:hypothetical protein